MGKIGDSRYSRVAWRRSHLSNSGNSPNLARAQYPLCIHVTIEFSFVIFVIFLTIGPYPRGDCIAFERGPGTPGFTRQARSGTDGGAMTESSTRPYRTTMTTICQSVSSANGAPLRTRRATPGNSSSAPGSCTARWSLNGCASRDLHHSCHTIPPPQSAHCALHKGYEPSTKGMSVPPRAAASSSHTQLLERGVLTSGCTPPVYSTGTPFESITGEGTMESEVMKACDISCSGRSDRRPPGN